MGELDQTTRVLVAEKEAIDEVMRGICPTMDALAMHANYERIAADLHRAAAIKTYTDAELTEAAFETARGLAAAYMVTTTFIYNGQSTRNSVALGIRSVVARVLDGLTDDMAGATRDCAQAAVLNLYGDLSKARGFLSKGTAAIMTRATALVYWQARAMRTAILRDREKQKALADFAYLCEVYGHPGTGVEFVSLTECAELQRLEAAAA